MLYKDIEKLVRLLESSQLDELEWEKNKEKVRLKKTASGPVQTVMASAPVASAPAPVAASPAPLSVASPAASSTTAPAAPASTTSASAGSKSGKEVACPFVGTYYEAPSPGAKNYVEVGQEVKKGDVLCIIEAMKIMNEIEAEFAGVVTEILVKNGQAVQFGQPLFMIDPK